MFGHINNVMFVRLLEEARVAVLGTEMITHSQEADGTALLVARQEIEYLTPLTFRIPPVAIDVWVTRIGASDFEMGYEVLDEGAGPGGRNVIYAWAETTLFAFDMAGRRPRRLTEQERTRLQGWSGEPVRWKRRREKAGTP